MFPTLEEIKKITETTDCRRIPACREIYSDAFTPIEVMRTLKAASRHCYLLESAENDQKWGRYSFLGYAPTMELTCMDGQMTIRRGAEEEEQTTETFTTEHPGDTIRKILAEYKSPKIKGLPPFTGGLVGYFSYDYLKYAEPTLRFSEEGSSDFRDVDLMLFDKVIAFDHYHQKICLITGVSTDDLAASYEKAEKELDEMEALLKSGAKAVIRPLKLKSPLAFRYSKETYCQMVEKAKHYIHEGDIFQVVLSDPMSAPAEGSLFDTYRVLRTTNPSPYMFYFSSDDIEVAGASPETLANLNDGTLHTFPLAGTRPRGKSEEEDQNLETELLKDEKSWPSTTCWWISEETISEESARSAPWSLKITCPFSVTPTSCTSAPQSAARSAWTRTLWTLWMPSSRQAPSPVRRRSGPARSSGNWRDRNGAFTAEPSDIWISAEISIPVSPSVSPIRKTAAWSSSPAPASWPTAFLKTNLPSAPTKPGLW